MSDEHVTHAARCRALASQATTATLCTIACARDVAGYPYGSLVTIAFDATGRPLLLLSTLAEHTTNLAARPEASVLVTDAADGSSDALARGRMTILGACRPVAPHEQGAVRTVFLARNPSAAQYAGFKDFAFYRLEPASIRYVGGFGRMSWVAAEEYARAVP